MSQLSARPKREERVAVDNNAFWGVWGFTPERAKGTALCIKSFIFLLCANSIDFLVESYRLIHKFSRKLTCWASRTFALGGLMEIYKPLNYDATMLIRLTTEMKDAFFWL